jgi:glycerol uptake facilitator-like aquaporin
VPATPSQPFRLSQRVTAEAVGTALLLAAVVGSGIMGENLAGGNVALGACPGIDRGGRPATAIG